MAMERRFYWTKVWGAPGDPAHEALAFNSEKTRDDCLAILRPGDIVVFLTSDKTEADPMVRGRVAGAAEVADPPEPVMVEEIRGEGRTRPEDFRDDGRFRWPYGITVSRTWHAIDQEANNALIPDHASKGIQGAATLHAMSVEDVARLMRLRVVEQVEGEEAVDRLPFSSSLRRPWRQKAGMRAGAEVVPGTELYIALIHDAHGTTFKVGSGKAAERLAALNLYRRGSQGEMLWSMHQSWEFDTVEAARAAEDHIIARAREMGFGSLDHPEFIVKIPMKTLAQLFDEALAVGLAVETGSEAAPATR